MEEQKYLHIILNICQKTEKQIHTSKIGEPFDAGKLRGKWKWKKGSVEMNS